MKDCNIMLIHQGQLLSTLQYKPPKRTVVWLPKTDKHTGSSLPSRVLYSKSNTFSLDNPCHPWKKLMGSRLIIPYFFNWCLKTVWLSSTCALVCKDRLKIRALEWVPVFQAWSEAGVFISRRTINSLFGTGTPWVLPEMALVLLKDHLLWAYTDSIIDSNAQVLYPELLIKVSSVLNFYNWFWKSKCILLSKLN